MEMRNGMKRIWNTGKVGGTWMNFVCPYANWSITICTYMKDMKDRGRFSVFVLFLQFTSGIFRSLLLRIPFNPLICRMDNLCRVSFLYFVFGSHSDFPRQRTVPRPAVFCCAILSCPVHQILRNANYFPTQIFVF